MSRRHKLNDAWTVCAPSIPRLLEVAKATGDQQLVQAIGRAMRGGQKARLAVLQVLAEANRITGEINTRVLP